MYKIYVDEKGTQYSYKQNKNGKGIRMAGDKMETFICSAIAIPMMKENAVKCEFLSIENTFIEKYYSNSKDTKYNEEIKTAYLFKRKKFKYGFNSSNNKELSYANQILDLCLNNELNICNASVHKIGTIISTRLKEWILRINKTLNHPNELLLFYSFTKYLQNNASKEVYDKLFDTRINSYELLKEIKTDLNNIINENIGNKRMEKQVINYKELLFYIEKSKKLNFNSNFTTEYKMDWHKIIFQLESWLSKNMSKNFTEINNSYIYLDNGLPKEEFEKLNVKNVYDGLDSKEYYGLRIADFIAVIVGNYISLLSEQSKHDENDLTKIIRLDSNWFNSSIQQFKIIKKLSRVLLEENSSVIKHDVFFDDTFHFELYLKYYNTFDNYSDFQKRNSNEHSEYFFCFAAKHMTAKYGEIQHKGIENIENII